jgi:hypothetical protein
MVCPYDMNRKIGFLFLLLFSALLFIYLKNRWGAGNIYEKVPVEVYRHSIIVPVDIGGKTYSFHLDTGAPSSISEALYAELGLSATDSSASMDYYGNRSWRPNSILPEIQIGHTVFSDVHIGIVDPIQSFLYCDKTIDGYLGSDFFSDKMLMIDLLGKEIVITNDRSKLPIRRQDAMSLSVIGLQRAPVVNLKFPPKFEESVLFDTGSSNHLYRPSLGKFTKMFAAGVIDPDMILDTLYNSKGRGLYGVQQDSINFLVRYDTLQIGDTKFTNFRTSTFGGGGPGSVLGAPLLSKGIVTVDWKHQHFYFDPYPDQMTDFITTSGFELIAKDDKFYTTSTHPESVAYSYGIRDGFALKQLNDIQFGVLSDCGLLNFDWFYEWSKPEVTVKLEFEGQEYCINESKNPLYQKM